MTISAACHTRPSEPDLPQRAESEVRAEHKREVNIDSSLSPLPAHEDSTAKIENHQAVSAKARDTTPLPSDITTVVPEAPDTNSGQGANVTADSSKKPEQMPVSKPPEIVVDGLNSFYKDAPQTEGTILKITLVNEGERTAFGTLVTLDLLQYNSQSHLLTVVPTYRYIQRFEDNITAQRSATLSIMLDTVLTEVDGVWSLLKICRTYEDKVLNQRLSKCSYFHANHGELREGQLALAGDSKKGQELQTRLFNDPLVLQLIKASIQSGSSKAMAYPPQG